MSVIEPNTPETLVRHVPAELAGDGRTLIARIVPYGVTARVADPPDYLPYDECFEKGAFDRQVNAANRVGVFLNFRHRQGLGDIVGRGVKLEERPDGLHGEFRLLAHSDGEKARELIEAGDLNELSLEFRPVRQRVVDGVVHRVKVILDAVALTPTGSYPGAEVLALREEADIEFPPPDPLEFDPELAARLARFASVPVLLGGTVETA